MNHPSSGESYAQAALDRECECECEIMAATRSGRNDQLKFGRKVLYEIAALDEWLATKRTTQAGIGRRTGGLQRPATRSQYAADQTSG